MQNKASTSLLIVFFQGLHFVFATILFLVLMIIFLPFIWCINFLPERYGTRTMFQTMHNITPFWMRLIGIFPQQHFTENAHKHPQFVITPNHQSYFDAAQVYCTVNKPFKSLGKVSILKIPLIRHLFKHTVIPVDRGNAQARATSLRHMKQHIDRGHSLLIFPEGTFPDQAQNQLLPFQIGAFALAIQYQVPVLPVLFPDCVQRMHPKQFWRMSPGVSRTLFLPPIETQHLEKKDLRTLTEYTQQYMQVCLNHYRENGLNNFMQFAHHWRSKHPLIA